MLAFDVVAFKNSSIRAFEVVALVAPSSIGSLSVIVMVMVMVMVIVVAIVIVIVIVHALECDFLAHA